MNKRMLLIRPLGLLKTVSLSTFAFYLVACGPTYEVTEELSSPEPFVPEVSEEVALKRADSLVQLMSFEEKLDFVKGFEAFFIRPYPQYGIPAIYLSDATQGLNIRRELDSTYVKQLDKSTAFPAPLSLAATWNTALAHDYARSVGEECRAGGTHVLLGPGFNLYRNAQCGRNYEYFGEDPYLISRMIEQYVLGVQSTGVMSTLKHFIANQSDFYRRSSNSIIDDRTLHEIYTAGFKAGIDAGVMSVMTSYNQVNGEWTGQSEFIINNLLRDQLGFKHLVMTDWYSVYDAEKIIKSGQDLVMPKGQHLTGVDTLIAQGKVQEVQLDRMVRNIIKSCIMMGFYDRPQKDTKYLETFPAHLETALQTAREGIVLLKNQDNVLPLSSDLKILLTGKFIDTLAIPGGSGKVEGYDWLSLTDAIKNEFGKKVTINNTPSDEEIAAADVVLLSTGNFGNEGADMPYTLLAEDDAFAKRVCELNPNVVVLINANGGINMMQWQDKTAAIVHAWYQGQIGNQALAEILSGKTNPSGKLPITIEKQFSDSPAFGYLPEGEEVTHTKPPWDFPRKMNDIPYEEGVFVGYRWYESKEIEPLFPFGHGLSYTNFKYSELKVKELGEQQVEVTFLLQNSGDRLGKEIVQVYVKDKEASVPRPLKELKAFHKVELAAGEIKKVKLTLKKQDFSFWNPETQSWYFEEGEFEILVGASSVDIRLSGEVRPSFK